MLYDNWLEWSYDEKPCAPPSTLTSKFNLKINRISSRKIEDYYTELLNNASRVRDSTSGPLDLFFSGGVNSQIILRTYLDLKIPVNLYVVRYNDGINCDDVIHAEKICKSLNCQYQIIDFNLQSFFENDVEDIYQKCFSLEARKLVLLKVIEKTTGTPIFGDNEFYFVKKDNSWLLKLTEENFRMLTCSKNFNRSMMPSWFYHSPELLLSYLQLPTIKNLFENNLIGKMSSASIRGVIHKEYWKDFVDRKKMIGFENYTKYILPEYVLEFYESKKIFTKKQSIYYFEENSLKEKIFDIKTQ